MHLTLEALARIVDEPAAPAEAEHLRDCLVCRRELAGLREQTEALAALGGSPSPQAWDDLRARLEDEGLLRAGGHRHRFGGAFRTQARAAAAVLLVLAGGAGAMLWQGRTPAPIAAVRGDAGLPVRSDRATDGFAGVPGVVYTYDGPAAAPANGARLASNVAEPAPAARIAPRLPDPPAARASAREADRAARELVEAQASFVVALQRLAAAADPASGNDPETRLAVLDRLVRLTASALERAPGDPVVNGYHLAAAAEHERLRREIEKDSQTTWF